MDVQWIVAAIAIFIAGGGLGFLLGLVLRKGDNAKLADAEAELEAYKRDVTEHFGQSAQHFQAIGNHYRELYEHMASGSEKLCGPIEASGALKFPRPAEVAIDASAADLDATVEPAIEDAVENHEDHQEVSVSDVETDTATETDAEPSRPKDS